MDKTDILCELEETRKRYWLVKKIPAAELRSYSPATQRAHSEALARLDEQGQRLKAALEVVKENAQ